MFALFYRFKKTTGAAFLSLVFLFSGVQIFAAPDNLPAPSQEFGQTRKAGNQTGGTQTAPATQPANVSGVLSCAGAPQSTPSWAHVPVWDSIATNNLDILVYKECVLDVINNQIKQAFIASVVKNAVRSLTGDGKNPQFVTDPIAHYNQVKEKTLQRMFEEGQFNTICSPHRDAVVDALKKTFQKNNKPFTCTLETQKLQACEQGDLQACGGLEGFYKYALSPNNNPVFAYYKARAYTRGKLAEAEANERQMLDWGRGFKPKTKTETITLDDGTVIKRDIVTTPGYLIAQYASDIMGTGLRQLETADEFNEMIGVLMQQLGNAVITGDGFTGLAKGIEYGTSYLDSLSSETQTGTTEGVTGAYLMQVSSKLTHVNRGISVVTGLLDDIIKEEKSARDKEVNTCFARITSNARSELKKDACARMTGTTTCAATIKAITYEDSFVETYESAYTKVAGHGFAPSGSPLSLEFKDSANKIIARKTDITPSALGSLYSQYKYTAESISVATSTSPGIVSVFATQPGYRTLGELKFEKKDIGVDGYKQPFLVFSNYDYPNWTIVYSHPTTTATISYTLDLRKAYTQNLVRKYSLVARKQNLLDHLSRYKKMQADLLWAQQVLNANPTQSDFEQVNTILSGIPSNTDILNSLSELSGNTADTLSSFSYEKDMWDNDGQWCSAGTKNNYCGYLVGANPLTCN